jgi:hypothetical protein
MSSKAAGVLPAFAGVRQGGYLFSFFSAGAASEASALAGSSLALRICRRLSFASFFRGAEAVRRFRAALFFRLHVRAAWIFTRPLQIAGRAPQDQIGLDPIPVG